MPAVALSTVPMAIIARMTRSAMLDVLRADYVRTARAKACANGPSPGATPSRTLPCPWSR
jgi:ABC-type dipeptide/oligopeptide/nickel transport system permease component